MQQNTAIYQSPIGPLTIFSDGEFITRIYTEQVEYFSPFSVDEAISSGIAWLDQYFAGKNPDINSLSLKAAGTPFQQDVWNRLRSIPYGCTVTYGQLAAQIAADRGVARMSAQAVGQAVGANPISIIIPCHRVIGANGNLVGYAGGLDKKIKLLNLESEYSKQLMR